MERYHNFELIIYYKPTIFNSIINDDKNILHYAYIFHDKDVVTNNDINNNDRYTINDLNKPKEPHYHLLINFKDAKTFNSCLTKFTIPGYSTRVIPINENKKRDRFEYLYHLNDIDKFQYAQDLIVTDNSNFWLNVQSSNNEKTINLINDIISNRPLRELLETYGRDFVINYTKYVSFANELMYCESNFQKTSSSEEVIVDSRDGVVKGVEDCSIDTDFLLNAFKKD